MSGFRSDVSARLQPCSPDIVSWYARGGLESGSENLPTLVSPSRWQGQEVSARGGIPEEAMSEPLGLGQRIHLSQRVDGGVVVPREIARVYY
jgi:hypothetical protein